MICKECKSSEAEIEGYCHSCYEYQLQRKKAETIINFLNENFIDFKIKTYDELFTIELDKVEINFHNGGAITFEQRGEK